MSISPVSLRRFAVTIPNENVRRLWLPRIRGEKLKFVEAPARMGIAVGLGWSGKGVMLLSPVAGPLFFIPLAMGAASLAASGLLLVSGPAKVVIDRQAGNVMRRRRGIRLPRPTNQALHLFSHVAVVRAHVADGGLTARFRSAWSRFKGILGRDASDGASDQAWEVHLVSVQDGVAPVVLGGFGPDHPTAFATARSVAEFTGLPLEADQHKVGGASASRSAGRAA